LTTAAGAVIRTKCIDYIEDLLFPFKEYNNS